MTKLLTPFLSKVQANQNTPANTGSFLVVFYRRKSRQLKRGGNVIVTRDC